MFSHYHLTAGINPGRSLLASILDLSRSLSSHVSPILCQLSLILTILDLSRSLSSHVSPILCQLSLILTTHYCSFCDVRQPVNHMQFTSLIRCSYSLIQSILPLSHSLFHLSPIQSLSTLSDYYSFCDVLQPFG